MRQAVRIRLEAAAAAGRARAIVVLARRQALLQHSGLEFIQLALQVRLLLACLLHLVGAKGEVGAQPVDLRRVLVRRLRLGILQTRLQVIGALAVLVGLLLEGADPDTQHVRLAHRLRTRGENCSVGRSGLRSCMRHW